MDFIDDELLKDKYFVLKALEVDYDIANYISDELKHDSDVILKLKEKIQE